MKELARRKVDTDIDQQDQVEIAVKAWLEQQENPSLRRYAEFLAVTDAEDADRNFVKDRIETVLQRTKSKRKARKAHVTAIKVPK